MATDNKICLDKNTKIVGLFDIAVSKVDNTIFISNKKINDPGSVNSFALYADEEGRIKPAGIDLTYDTESSLLKSKLIEASNIDIKHTLLVSSIEAGNVDVEHNLKSSNIEVDVLTVNQYLDIDSISVNNSFNRCLIFMDNDHSDFSRIHYDNINGHQTLAFLTKKNNGNLECAVTIDQHQRLELPRGILNLRKDRVIKSRVGTKGDLAGDIFINDGYIYYCKETYDGIRKIWVRTKIDEDNW